MKRIILLYLLLIISTYVSCKEEALVTKEKVEVKITGIEYHETSQNTVLTNQGSFVSEVPEEYIVIVEYQNKQYKINSETVYKKYKNSIGTTITGTLEKQAGILGYSIAEMKAPAFKQSSKRVSPGENSLKGSWTCGVNFGKANAGTIPTTWKPLVPYRKKTSADTLKPRAKLTERSHLCCYHIRPR